MSGLVVARFALECAVCLGALVVTAAASLGVV